MDSCEKSVDNGFVVKIRSKVVGMIKHLIVSIGLIASCNMASAAVAVMDNAELDSVVVETQQEQLQPALPEYNANGQIGGVATIPTPVVGAVTPIPNLNANPVDQPLPPQLISALNQILNLAKQIK